MPQVAQAVQMTAQDRAKVASRQRVPRGTPGITGYRGGHSLQHGPQMASMIASVGARWPQAVPRPLDNLKRDDPRCHRNNLKWPPGNPKIALSPWRGVHFAKFGCPILFFSVSRLAFPFECCQMSQDGLKMVQGKTAQDGYGGYGCCYCYCYYYYFYYYCCYCVTTTAVTATTTGYGQRQRALPPSPSPSFSPPPSAIAASSFSIFSSPPSAMAVCPTLRVDLPSLSYPAGRPTFSAHRRLMGSHETLPC